MSSSRAEFRLPDVLGSEVARTLTDLLVFNEIPAGARLREEEIALRFGVSRSPVREAFRLLERDGLIVREPRCGVRVSPLTVQNLTEVYGCRATLEGYAAQEAARHRSEAQVEALRRRYAEMAAARDDPDRRSYFRHNVALSELVIEAAANRTLERLISSIGRQALRYRYLAYERVPVLVERSMEGNRLLVDAIADRDRRSARQAVRQMIANAARAISRILEAEAGDEE